MHDFFWLAAVPTVVFVLAGVVAALWWDAAHPRPAHEPPGPTLQYRWEHGAGDPRFGSMDLAAECRWKRVPVPSTLTDAERAEVNARAVEQARLWREPRPGAIVLAAEAEPAAQRYDLPGAPLIVVCPICEARDDEPHREGCWVGDDADRADNCMTIAIEWDVLPPLMMIALAAERQHQHAAWLAEHDDDSRAALRATLLAAWDALASS